MNGIIYKAENEINGKVYIGQTWKGLDLRKKSHFERKTGCTKFINAINKYGKNAFSWNILDSSDNQKNLDDLEIKYIKEYNSITNGYNLKTGGLGGKHSKESNIRNRESNLKFWKSKDERIKHSKRHGGKPFFAKKGDVLLKFEYQAIAAEELGVCRAKITQVLNVQRKTTGGWYFSYNDLSNFKCENRFYITKNGEDIFEFYKTSEAAKFMGIAQVSVQDLLRGSARQMKGWYASKNKDEIIGKRNKIIIATNGAEIIEFQKQKEACAYFGCSVSTIGSMLGSRTQKNVFRGWAFRYE